MIFNVTEIEFDFTDDEEGDVPLDCQQQTIDDCLGPWEADDEDDLIEEITCAQVGASNPSIITAFQNDLLATVGATSSVLQRDAQQDVTVYDISQDEFVPVSETHYTDENSQVLDPKHLYIGFLMRS